MAEVERIVEPTRVAMHLLRLAYMLRGLSAADKMIDGPVLNQAATLANELERQATQIVQRSDHEALRGGGAVETEL